MFEELIPELQDAARGLVLAAGQAGLQPRVTSTVRTRTQQARLYRRWQAGLSPFPAAPPGTSAHEYGYAFDMVVTPMEALADVGYTWQTWGGVWGENRDPVHFEYPGFAPPASEAQMDWWEIVSSLPIALWPSIVFQFLGIPASAKKDITPAQEETLRKIALSVKR